MNKTTNDNTDIINELIVAYGMELETVQNYIAASVNLDGVRSDVIKKSLAADVVAELGHAQLLANRIKTIGGKVPGSMKLKHHQESLQPLDDTTDVVSVIKGVIEAENGAIKQYNKIIRLCDGRDYVTQDMAITALADEEEHRREFVGFLKEYESPTPRKTRTEYVSANQESDGSGDNGEDEDDESDSFTKNNDFGD